MSRSPDADAFENLLIEMGREVPTGMSDEALLRLQEQAEHAAARKATERAAQRVWEQVVDEALGSWESY
jgi:hypothetical protein